MSDGLRIGSSTDAILSEPDPYGMILDDNYLARITHLGEDYPTSEQIGEEVFE